MKKPSWQPWSFQINKQKTYSLKMTLITRSNKSNAKNEEYVELWEDKEIRFDLPFR